MLRLDDRVKRDVIEFLRTAGALRFGKFTLKSGRVSPYFFNVGLFTTGRSLAELAVYYAFVVRSLEPVPTVLFGPAYKGIPLCIATAMLVHQPVTGQAMDVGWCFDRKEVKDHGEGGLLVGCQPKEDDRIVIIDDVITTGATKLEAIEKLQRATSAKITAIVIALNRCETDAQGNDPVKELERLSGIPVIPLATIYDILAVLDTQPEMQSHAVAIREYLGRYGVPQQ